jgi:PmbA protein
VERFEEDEMDKMNMLAIAQGTLDAAKAEGASDARCIVLRTRNERLAMREGKVSEYTPKTTASLILTVYCGNKRAVLKGLPADATGIRAFAHEAVELARLSGEHEFDGVPDAKYWPCTSEDFDELQEQLSCVDRGPVPDFHVLKGYAEELHDLSLAKEGVVRAEVSIAYVKSAKVFATTAGFTAFEEGSTWSIFAQVIGDDNGEIIVGVDGSRACTRAALRSFKLIAERAYRNMCERRGAVRPKSDTIHVIIRSDAADRVIDTVIDALDVDAAFRKKTFLLESIGERCASEALTITDFPHIKFSPYAGLFDDDGVATRDRVIVDRGVSTGWIGGYEECRKLGIEPTGNASGCTQVFVNPGTMNLEELCGKFSRVLVVTDFCGRGFDSETGEVSVGIEGYIIDNGKREVVHEAIIAGTMQEMLQQCIPANDVDTEGPIHVPSLYVGEMRLSGV